MLLSIEWIPKNAYTHNSLDHFLPMGDQDGRNVVFIKQEPEFLEKALNTQTLKNMLVTMQVPESKDKDENKQQTCQETPATVNFQYFSL